MPETIICLVTPNSAASLDAVTASPPEGGFFTFLFYSETTRQEASISKKPLCPVKLTLVYSIYTVAFSV